VAEKYDFSMLCFDSLPKNNSSNTKHQTPTKTGVRAEKKFPCML
jgi:hypothetical protein